MIITPWPPVTNVWRMNWYVGRPKNSWRRGTISELQVINTTWEETKRKVQDRTRWKETVDTLCPPWDEVEKSVSHVLPCLINNSSTSHINKQSSWLTLFMTIIPPPFRDPLCWRTSFNWYRRDLTSSISSLGHVGKTTGLEFLQWWEDVKQIYTS